MESFELALAHLLVQKMGYTWYPPGVLFAEPSLFRSQSGRGVLLRLIRRENLISFADIFESSFKESQEILRDHPYQSLTVIQLVVYVHQPDNEEVLLLNGMERFEAAPDIAIHTAWFDLETCSLHSNIPWYNRQILSAASLREAADLSSSRSATGDLQQQIEDALETRRAEWGKVFVQSSSKAVLSLLVLIIGMFVWMVTQGFPGNAEVLYRFGAKVNRLIVAGEYWRLVAPMFLHVSVLHLMVNSFALYSLRDAEWIYGSNRFLLIFLLSGVGGNIASFAFSPYPAAGASGAIFGLLGSLLYFGTQRKDFFRKTMGGAVWTTLLINLLLGFTIPQISISGHIGGLIGGFLAASAVGLPGQKLRRHQPVATVVYLILLLGLVKLGFTLWQ
jgi:rhomboid protease GluP